MALVRDARGNPVRSAAEVKPFQPLRLEFADGEVKVKEDQAPRQGSLF